MQLLILKDALIQKLAANVLSYEVSAQKLNSQLLLGRGRLLDLYTIRLTLLASLTVVNHGFDSLSYIKSMLENEIDCSENLNFIKHFK